jgi:hypothetical protein
MEIKKNSSFSGEGILQILHPEKLKVSSTLIPNLHRFKKMVVVVVFF